MICTLCFIITPCYYRLSLRREGVALLHRPQSPSEFSHSVAHLRLTERSKSKHQTIPSTWSPIETRQWRGFYSFRRSKLRCRTIVYPLGQPTYRVEPRVCGLDIKQSGQLTPRFVQQHFPALLVESAHSSDMTAKMSLGNK